MFCDIFCSIMKRCFALSGALLLMSFVLFGQNGDGGAKKEDQVIRFDAKNYDFGDVLQSEGALRHTFTFENISSSPIVIHNVISSCGCTTPEWSREPIRPGAKGKIEVVYSNDQGPYPFDKTLTVYVSNVDRPVVLRIRGTVHEQKKDIEELFNIRFGQLGLRKTTVSIGYVDQGTVKSDNMQVANMGKEPLKVEAVNITPGLEITVSPNPIPARSVAKMSYSVNTKDAATKVWGRKSYTTKFLLNGKPAGETFTINATIKDNFEGLSDAQLSAAPVPTVDKSYFEFGEVKAGKVFEHSYTITNKGKSDLIIYNVDGPAEGFSLSTLCPITIKAGAKGSVKIKFDTRKYSGEIIEILSVTTNSPSKPILNLFVTGSVF